MPNIPPISLDAAGATRPMLEDIRNQLGAVPNIFSTFAHSPAVLKGFLAFNGALGSGVLAATVREKIALAIAGANQCDYCAFAHSVLAAAAGIDKPESAINLTGSSSDARTQAMLNFVLSVVAQHGEISPDELETLRSFDISDAEIVEILAHVGINLFTNYFNHVVKTEIDFPFVAT